MRIKLKKAPELEGKKEEVVAKAPRMILKVRKTETVIDGGSKKGAGLKREVPEDDEDTERRLRRGKPEERGQKKSGGIWDDEEEVEKRLERYVRSREEGEESTGEESEEGADDQGIDRPQKKAPKESDEKNRKRAVSVEGGEEKGGRNKEEKEEEGREEEGTGPGLAPQAPSEAIVLSQLRNHAESQGISTEQSNLSVTLEKRNAPRLVFYGPKVDTDEELALLSLLPARHCSVCEIGIECSAFEEGKVCAFDKVYKALPVRDSESVLKLMSVIVETNKQRYFRAVHSENVVSGGGYRPEVTQLSDTLLRQTQGLLDLQNEVARVTVNVSGETEGAKETKRGLIASIFGAPSSPPPSLPQTPPQGERLPPVVETGGTAGLFGSGELKTPRNSGVEVIDTTANSSSITEPNKDLLDSAPIDILGSGDYDDEVFSEEDDE